jgi:hypothetical protein
VTPGDAARLWPLLRACLVDPEPLNRKRSAKLLSLLLPPGALSVNPAWSTLLSLFDLLEEFAAHLVKAAWPGVVALHAADPHWAAAGQDSAADVPLNTKMVLLRKAGAAGGGGERGGGGGGGGSGNKKGGKRTASAAAGDEAAAGRPGHSSAGGTPTTTSTTTTTTTTATISGAPGVEEEDGYVPPLDVAWAAVVWQRALQHENLQVGVPLLPNTIPLCHQPHSVQLPNVMRMVVARYLQSQI